MSEYSPHSLGLRGCSVRVRARSAWALRGAMVATIVVLALTARPGTAAAQAFDTWVRPSVVLQALGGSAVRGEAALVPAPGGDYRLRVTASLPQTLLMAGPPPGNLSWVVARGDCAGAAAAPTSLPANVFWRSTPASYERWASLDTVVARTWTAGPLVILGVDQGRGQLVACADLPLAEARAREPLAGAQPASSTIGSASGWQVAGRVQVWPTPSGDLFVRADVEAPLDAFHRSGSRTDLLLWDVFRGRCNLPGLAIEDRTRLGTAPVRTRFGEAIPPTGHQTIGLVVPRAEAGDGPLVLEAFAHGQNPLANSFVACADLPTRAVLNAATAPASLPRAGGGIDDPGRTLLAAGALLAIIGFALRRAAGAALTAHAPDSATGGQGRDGVLAGWWARARLGAVRAGATRWKVGAQPVIRSGVRRTRAARVWVHSC